MEPVSVRDLCMTYQVPLRSAGLRGAITSLAKREYREIEAVKSVSFVVDAGETVGLIGPNGAGKTTTLKILSGVLHPTSGVVTVLGATPWKRQQRYLRQIAMIRGSRPISGPPEATVLDMLRLQALIYELPESDFRRNLGTLSEMLRIQPFLNRQIRALSLGERMRVGLAYSLIYQPRVLYLDEPTLGLDVTAVGVFRSFIQEYGRTTNASIILTSHNMYDISELCGRLILIDQGVVRHDGSADALTRDFSRHKLIRVAVTDGTRPRWETFGDVVHSLDRNATLRVSRENVATTASALLERLPVADLSIEDPPLEATVRQIYQEGDDSR